MHNVEIDEATIDAVFDRYEQQADVTGEHIPAGDPEPIRSAWEKPARLAARFLANQVAPNWDIQPEDQDEWAQAVAECMDGLMPGGMGNIESWGPWGKLAFATGNIVLCGLDWETMSLKPLHITDDQEAPPAAPGAPGAHDPEPAAPGGQYKMGGE